MTEGKDNTVLSNDPLDDDEAKQHKILERQLGKSLKPRTFRFCKELFVRFHSTREIGELRWKEQILKWEIAQR
jgi:hypothetical protein